jgi:uncharacterized protein YecE (DUF72 family)
MSRAWIGCSAWSYDDWRGRLYPECGPDRVLPFADDPSLGV